MYHLFFEGRKMQNHQPALGLLIITFIVGCYLGWMERAKCCLYTKRWQLRTFLAKAICCRPSIRLSVGPIANLKGHYFQPSLSVCVSVCLWPALLPSNVNRFWRNLVARTLLWSSLAAAIMVQIGRRGTARRLFWKFQKILKNHRIWISKFCSIIFLRLWLLCIVKNRLDSNKTDGGDTFWSLPLSP